MTDLTPRDTELVALGAALASNCVPCIEYHIPLARKAGLTDAQIRAAVQLADNVRQVPARKVLDAALNLSAETAGCASDAAPSAGGCGCSSAAGDQARPATADRTVDTMAGMMSKMMASCAAAAGRNAASR